MATHTFHSVNPLEDSRLTVCPLCTCNLTTGPLCGWCDESAVLAMSDGDGGWHDHACIEHASEWAHTYGGAA